MRCVPEGRAIVERQLGEAQASDATSLDTNLCMLTVCMILLSGVVLLNSWHVLDPRSCAAH